MIKESKVSRHCRIIEDEVELAVCCYEDYRTGLKTPQKVEGCGSAERCRVKNGDSYNWHNCPLFGKQAKRIDNSPR